MKDFGKISFSDSNNTGLLGNHTDHRPALTEFKPESVHEDSTQ
jgi:hypothetical protein